MMNHKDLVEEAQDILNDARPPGDFAIQLDESCLHIESLSINTRNRIPAIDVDQCEYVGDTVFTERGDFLVLKKESLDRLDIILDELKEEPVLDLIKVSRARGLLNEVLIPSGEATAAYTNQDPKRVLDGEEQSCAEMCVGMVLEALDTLSENRHGGEAPQLDQHSADLFDAIAEIIKAAPR